MRQLWAFPVMARAALPTVPSRAAVRRLLCSVPAATPAFVICLRTGTSMANEWTQWRSEAEAVVAERELGHPCGPRCERAHVLVAYDSEGQPRSVPTAGPLPQLAVELAVLYHRPIRDGEPPPEFWDTPPEFNQPLEASPGPGITTQRINHGQAIALRRQLARVQAD